MARRVHLGGSDSPQYTALAQINKSNVTRPQHVWFYPAGENGFRFGVNPIGVGGVMYLLGAPDAVVALGAETGAKSGSTGSAMWSRPNHRGVVHWQINDYSDRRVLFTAGDHLQALDARTGNLVLSVRGNRRVNLKNGMGRDPDSLRKVQSSHPGRVFENLLILGSAPGQEYESAPGDLTGFDTRSGKLVEPFTPCRIPAEPGYETWPPDAWKYMGGVNTRGEISIDGKRVLRTSLWALRHTTSTVRTGRAQSVFRFASGA